MSTRLEHSDSDSNNSSSWILLDDKGKADDEEEEEEEEEEITPRKTIQDVHEFFEDSDGISIISDPEDSHTETNELTTDTAETKKEKDEEESTVGKELVSLEAKSLKTSGSVTSALFMIAGLLIALYFQTGCEDETTPAAKSLYTAAKTNNLVYETNKYKQLNNEDYISSLGKGINSKGEVEDGAHFKKSYKDYDKKPRYEENVKHEKGIKDKYFKKQKNYDASDEKKYKKKYYGSHENDYKYNKDREEYLMKKQHYLRQKEDKLKQKELKIHSKNSREYKMEDKRQFMRDKYINDPSMSGEWHGKMHKGRDEIRSNERRSEWVFDRAQMRDKKRDKAHWYFNWMDEREDVRFRG